MTRKPKARTRGTVPAGWTWRDGRPRWIPSPTLRKAGWRGRDLKDGKGEWLGRGASIDAAEAICRAVAAWRRGAPAPAELAGTAPSQAAAPAAPRALDRLSLGGLALAWHGDAAAETPPSNEFARLAPKTQADYRHKLKRLFDVLGGYVELPARDDADAQTRYAAVMEAVRHQPVQVLAPEEGEGGLVDLLYDAYWTLHAKAGKHAAYGVLAVASTWLAWGRERQSRSIRNWAAEVSRETPPGRLRPLAWAEVKALVAAADALGLHSIGDAVVLGVDLSWSQVDRLALTWAQLRDGRAHGARAKTGRVGGTPLTSLGLARVAVVAERQRAMAAQPTHVIWCERTGAPWKPDHYRHVFAEVRAAAAKKVPSVADATDADLRDTAVTWGREAGLVDDETASRTLQSRKHIGQLLDKHYGEIGPGIADAGRDKLDAWMRQRGMTL